MWNILSKGTLRLALKIVLLATTVEQGQKVHPRSNFEFSHKLYLWIAFNLKNSFAHVWLNHISTSKSYNKCVKMSYGSQYSNSDFKCNFFKTGLFKYFWDHVKICCVALQPNTRLSRFWCHFAKGCCFKMVPKISFYFGTLTLLID